MYRAHFGLSANPFSSSPSAEYIYESKEHREALAHFRYALANREAFLLLTGEVGTGKTTAVQALRRLLPSGTPVAVVSHTTLEPRELIEEIALRFGLEPVPGESKPALMRRMETFLEDRRRGGGHALLILDEAHLLTRPLLEEVRLLSNLESEGGGKLLQICLVGQPELLANLQQPELRQLRQRISVRYTLKPLSREETAAYIYHRLMVAGCDHPAVIFPPEATDAVYSLTQGIPREINVVAGQALLNAYLEEAPEVSRSHVVSVKSDYGFEGIVTGAAALTPETPPTPLPPRRAAAGPVPPPPAPPSPEPGRQESKKAETSGGGPRPQRKAIPLPPRSLQPEPRDRPPSSEEETATSEPGKGAPAGRLTPGVGTRSRPEPATKTGGNRRRLSLLVAAGVVVVLLAVWWVEAGRETRPPSLEEEMAGAPALTPAEHETTDMGVSTSAVAGVSASAAAALPAAENAQIERSIPPTGAGVASGESAAPAGEEAVTGGKPVSPGQAIPSAPQKRAPSPPAGIPSPPSNDGSPASSLGARPPQLLAVQVASFHTERKARQVLADVTRRTGLPGVVLPAQVHGLLWYRILLGAFPTQASAEQAAAPLLQRRIIREVVVRKIPSRWVPVLTGQSPQE